MEIYVSVQAAVFLWTVLGGIITACLYDIFRISRKLFSVPSWAVFVCDIVFWILCSIVNFVIILEKNSGEIRWFLFFGIALGGVLYFSLLSRYFQKISLFLLKIIVRLVLAVKRILSVPCGFLMRILKILGRKIKTRKGNLKKHTSVVCRKWKSQLSLVGKIRKSG